MRIALLLFILTFLPIACTPQKSIDNALAAYNKKSVPYISLEEFKATDSVLLLDTRKKEEYDVSHIKGAVWAGHKGFDIDDILKTYPKKDTSIVVYCSIGVRSEDIGEKLQKAGYTNVKNLYGGIFKWKNNKNPIYDSNGNKTEKIHAFSKFWSKLLTNGQKVY